MKTKIEITIEKSNAMNYANALLAEVWALQQEAKHLAEFSTEDIRARRLAQIEEMRQVAHVFEAAYW